MNDLIKNFKRKMMDLNNILFKSILGVLLFDAIAGDIIGLCSFDKNNSALFNDNKFLVYFAIIDTAFLFAYAIFKIVKTLKIVFNEKRIAKEEAEKKRKEEEAQRELERKRRLEEERKQKEEKERISAVEEEIEKIKANYTFRFNLPEIEDTVINNDKSTDTVPDVKRAVLHYKKKSSEDVDKCNELTKQINDILNKELSPDEKLAYLQKELTNLDRIKKERNDLISRLRTRKIELIDENSATIDLDVAFIELKQSKVCNTGYLYLDKLLSKKRPKELNFFSYKYKPIVFFSNSFFYCVFSNTILVFDESGYFVNSLGTWALNMKISRITESVTISNNSEYGREFSAEDSKLISKGATYSHWLYSCKDGSPDLRYSGNQLIESRTDEYEYGKLSFRLKNEIISCRFSSEKAINAFEKVAPIFSGSRKNKQDNSYRLFDLIKTVSENEESKKYIDEISSKSKHKKVENAYCRIIGE